MSHSKIVSEQLQMTKSWQVVAIIDASHLPRSECDFVWYAEFDVTPKVDARSSKDSDLKSYQIKRNNLVFKTISVYKNYQYT